jgi:pteridine reductase
MSERSFVLTKSHILITGGARRVGKAITEALARTGARVLIHANRSMDEAVELVDRLRESGFQADAVQADLGSPEDLSKLARAIGPGGEFPVNGIVHAASPYAKIPLLELTLSDLDSYYAVHLRAPVALAQALYSRVLESPDQQARIVHITDASLRRPYGGYAAYLSTKQALDGLTRALAVEMAPHVLVNNVAPGTVLPPETAGPDYVRALARKSPLQRTGNPEDVARAVLFLFNDPGFMTGSTITVDGGACMS